MRVIDLLNRIANGEELPKKIKYEGDIWELNTLENTYDNGECCLFEDYIDKKYVITDVLNDEIEIIEDTPKISKLYINNKLQYDLSPKEDKKIEKINLKGYTSCLGTDEEWTTSEEIIIVKINEIIDKLNKEE